MDDAAAVLQRWEKAQQERDLDALVSCWHPDVDTVHILRPDRSSRVLTPTGRRWRGIWKRVRRVERRLSPAGSWGTGSTWRP